MKLNDPARFARELQGDFSEIDAHIRANRFEALAFLLGLACYLYVFRDFLF